MARKPPMIFLSHATEEKNIAEYIKQQLTDHFLGLVNVFVASDKQSISLGEKWLNEIDSALSGSKLELLLCSPSSLNRPWIYFEAGAGWIRKIPVVPICHSGILPSKLPPPLNSLQGIDATDPEGWRTLYEQIAQFVGTKAPKPDFSSIVKGIPFQVQINEEISAEVSKNEYLEENLLRNFGQIAERKRLEQENFKKEVLKILQGESRKTAKIDGQMYRVGDRFPVPSHRWVTVLNIEPIKSINSVKEFGDTCSINEEGELEIVGFYEKDDDVFALVKFITEHSRGGAKCADGTIFMQII